MSTRAMILISNKNSAEFKLYDETKGHKDPYHDAIQIECEPDVIIYNHSDGYPENILYHLLFLIRDKYIDTSRGADYISSWILYHFMHKYFESVKDIEPGYPTTGFGIEKDLGYLQSCNYCYVITQDEINVYSNFEYTYGGWKLIFSKDLKDLNEFTLDEYVTHAYNVEAYYDQTHTEELNLPSIYDGDPEITGNLKCNFEVKYDKKDYNIKSIQLESGEHVACEDCDEKFLGYCSASEEAQGECQGLPAIFITGFTEDKKISIPLGVVDIDDLYQILNY